MLLPESVVTQFRIDEGCLDRLGGAFYPRRGQRATSAVAYQRGNKRDEIPSRPP